MIPLSLLTSRLMKSHSQWTVTTHTVIHCIRQTTRENFSSFYAAENNLPN